MLLPGIMDEIFGVFSYRTMHLTFIVFPSMKKLKEMNLLNFLVLINFRTVVRAHLEVMYEHSS